VESIPRIGGISRPPFSGGQERSSLFWAASTAFEKMPDSAWRTFSRGFAAGAGAYHHWWMAYGRYPGQLLQVHASNRFVGNGFHPWAAPYFHPWAVPAARCNSGVEEHRNENRR
jgi:hypothetical protein